VQSYDDIPFCVELFCNFAMTGPLQHTIFR
jgi:hypothetical protein